MILGFLKHTTIWNNWQLKSLLRTAVFNKGNYEKRYKLDEIFQRDDLIGSYKKTRKIKNN